MGDWQAFQADVLDTMRQYRGYMDFYEQIGSMESSRPDCFCRVTRDDKKEIWIVDAKEKNSLSDGDVDRMEKYRNLVRAEPVDVGLTASEVPKHEIRSIFVTRNGAQLEEYECVPVTGLHQFLQKELVYTDTDRAVQDISKMVKNRQLSHSQARMLYRSLKPYIDTLNASKRSLKELETRYAGLELLEPPISSYDSSLPVDAVLKHSERQMSFLIDIPYSKKSVNELDNRVEELRKLLSDSENVYYAALNRFDSVDSKWVYRPEELEAEIKSTAGIVSAEEVAEWFKPKIPLEREIQDGALKYVSEGFTLQVATENDVEHRVTALLPDGAAKALSDRFSNSMVDFGSLKGNRFQMDLEVTKNNEIKYPGGSESPSSFESKARNLFRSTLGREIASKIAADS